jgi:hypothetical protein
MKRCYAGVTLQAAPSGRGTFLGVTRSILRLAGALILVSTCCSETIDQAALLDMYGIYLDESGRSGTITLNSDSGGSEIRGELALAGQPVIPLTGSYHNASGSLSFASDDQSYVFQGGLGSYAGGTGDVPAGRAAFALFVNRAPSSVTTYCGPQVCTAPEGCISQGVVQVAINGSSALLTFMQFGQEIVVGPGGASMTAVSFQVGAPQSTIDLFVQGNRDGAMVTGTWTDALAGISGTWEGTTSPCAGAVR